MAHQLPALIPATRSPARQLVKDTVRFTNFACVQLASLTEASAGELHQTLNRKLHELSQCDMIWDMSNSPMSSKVVARCFQHLRGGHSTTKNWRKESIPKMPQISGARFPQEVMRSPWLVCMYGCRILAVPGILLGATADQVELFQCCSSLMGDLAQTARTYRKPCLPTSLNQNNLSLCTYHSTSCGVAPDVSAKFARAPVAVDLGAGTGTVTSLMQELLFSWYVKVAMQNTWLALWTSYGVRLHSPQTICLLPSRLN